MCREAAHRHDSSEKGAGISQSSGSRRCPYELPSTVRLEGSDRSFRGWWVMLFKPLLALNLLSPPLCATREPVPPGVQPFVEETAPALQAAKLLHCRP